MDCQVCLVCQDRRVCPELKEWLEKMARKELVVTQDLAEILALMESQERLDPLDKWDLVV